MRNLSTLTGLFICLILTACGGGGSGGSDNTPPVTASKSSVQSSLASSTSLNSSSSIISSISSAASSLSSNSSQTSVYSAGVASLKDLAAFPIGVAVSYGTESYSYNSSPAQQAVIKTHFSQLTAGNIMKMSYLHPGETTFNFTQADDFLKFATDNNIKLHAHTLIWHSDYQVPAWMKNYAGDKTAWLAMLKTHEQTIASHFAGKVTSWDVVNEALNDGGGYRNSIFYQKTGADYIEQAYINAHDADQTADLYYNDYNIEADAAKLKSLTDMLDGFITRNVPISGVGFQMHIYSDYPSVDTIKASFQKIVDRHLKVKISELDIPINNPYSNAYKSGDIKTTLTLELALAQKKRYCEVVKAYLDTVPTELRGGITVWGVSDPSSWLIAQLFNNAHDDWPLLFDKDYHDKPALRGVADALNGQPCTNL